MTIAQRQWKQRMAQQDIRVVVLGAGMAGILAGIKLRERGIRTHARMADHYSGNILDPLGLVDSSRNWRKMVSGQRLWYFESRDASAWLMI